MPEVQATNSSGGVLGGDRLQAEMDLAPGSSVTVPTRAANKAYREKRPPRRRSSARAFAREALTLPAPARGVL